MSSFVDNRTLENLIKNCSSQVVHEREEGWKIFIQRYKRFIYKVLLCQIQKIHKKHWIVNKQDVLDELLNLVLIELCRNNCSSLRKFRAVDSEKAFLAYLSVICIRVTNRYIDQFSLKSQDDEDNVIAENVDYQYDNITFFFEYIVKKLRTQSGKKEKNQEIKILTFNLHVIDDWSLEMLRCLPFLKRYSLPALEQIIRRTRLKFNNDDKNNLSENN